MKKFTRRKLCGALALLVISAATAGGAAAVNTTTPFFVNTVEVRADSVEDGFIVEGNTLVRYEGKGGEVKLPEDIGILRIGEEAFSDNDTITKVILSSSVSAIGKRAFANCKNLVQVTLAQGGTDVDIGEEAFENCGSTAEGSFRITNADRIRSLGARAFANSSLQSLGALENLKTIGTEVFVGSRMNSYMVSDTLNLDEWQISGTPFLGVELKVASTATRYTVENGVVYDKSKTKIYFVNASSEGEFALPTMVTSVKEYAFSGSNVTKIVLNKRLKTLGEGAFACVTLQTVEFGESALTAIPTRCFFGSGVTTIELPSAITEIGDEAFAECTGLRTIKISKSVREMGARVFKDCTALNTAELPALEKLGEETFLGTTSLKTVEFDAAAETTGEWTFKETSVKTVVLGENITKIEQGAFYGATSLTEFSIPQNVDTIEAYAFAECKNLKSADGLENVKSFGAYAFSNTGLKTLNLRKATEIGEGAFAVMPKNNESVSSYTTLNMPMAETIGAYAFYNGDMSLVKLPATVKTIGEGAFASARYLNKIRVDEQNEYFFAEENVLYRYTDKDGGRYALTCYPSARTATAQSGEKSYSVKEGTERVDAYTFFELNANVLNKVILPYSVRTIGDRAFYASGVKTYRFECIDAPVLEFEYRADAEERIAVEASDATAEFYRNCPIANFETELCNYSEFGFDESELTMYYPENGTGYDSDVYTLYFNEKVSIGILSSETTKLCIAGIQNLPDEAELQTYKTLPVDEENLALVNALAEDVKTVRKYYNEIKDDEQQLALLDKSDRQKLFDTEAILREVKARFGIPVQVVRLEISEESRHKSKYLEGGVFELFGLVVSLVYDDLSVQTISGMKLTLSNTEKLTTSDTFVTVEYQGLSLQIPITVTESVGTVVGADSSDENTGVSPKEIALFVMGATALLVIGIVLWVLLKNRVGRGYAERKSQEDVEDEYDDFETDSDEA